jgi:hypothetical protein
MRIKFLSLIVGFLFVSIAVTSCLNSDNNYDYSSDATIRAFGIDTIHGKHYKFTIDQLKGEIYNADSLPVGADTIIDRILIDTLNVSGWVTSGVTDTLFNIKDSLDLRSPIKVKVHAPDGSSVREYTIKVNIHKQDPDLLVWEDMGNPLSSTPISSQKSVLLNGNHLFTYTSSTEVYQALTDRASFQWLRSSVSGLPVDVKLSSLINFQNKLFAVTTGGDLYNSVNGLDWTKVNTGGIQFTNLLSSFSTSITGIEAADGKKYFCTSSDGIIWTKGEEIPDNFPVENIYATLFETPTGMEKTVIVGYTGSIATSVVPWFSLNGYDWADLASNSENYCPFLQNPSIINYGGAFYILGGNFDKIYKSTAGIAWYETKKKFLFPAEMAGENSYSMVVDKNNYIWVIIGQTKKGSGAIVPGKTWRGRLNRLGFIQQ